MFVESDRSISIQARNESGRVSATIDLGKGRATATCDRFEIFDMKGHPLFAADSNEVAVKVEHLRILGDGGSVFEGSVLTEVVRPETKNMLRYQQKSKK